MNVLAMEKELKDPDEEDIKEYLFRKFMPLQRIYVPAACCKKISGYEAERKGGIRKWHIHRLIPATGKKFRLIGAPVVKKDAKALVTGKPVYTDDLALKDCLIVKSA